MPIANAGRAFRSGVDLVLVAGRASCPDLRLYPEHMDGKFQADLVSRLRVAVRLFIAKAYRESLRVRASDDRVIEAAFQAGKYFGEYRRHFSHLRSLPGYRPTPTYGPSHAP